MRLNLGSILVFNKNVIINTSRYKTGTSSSDYIYHMTILRIIVTAAYSTSLVWPAPVHNFTNSL